MEEQLRAYAESRRLEAPSSFELDAPARRRLHDEVRSVYRSEPLPGQGRLSGWFWARLAFVGASAALVLFVSVQFLSDNQPVQLAQHSIVTADQARERVAEMSAVDEARRSEKAPVPSSRVADTPPDKGELSKVAQRPMVPAVEPASPRAPLVAASRGQPSATTAIPPGEPVAAGPTPELFSANDLEPRAMNLASSGDLASRDGLETKPLAGESLAFGAADSTWEPRVETLTLDQSFHQIQRYRRNPNSPMPPQVLQSFRWIRDGDAVTVVDADGSVYRGQMGANQSATQVSPSRFAVQASREISAPGPSRLQPQSLQAGLGGVVDGERFAVSGTNRTLNLLVEFEGVLGSQAAAPQTPTVATAATGEQSASGETALQIQGQAQVGPTTRLGIVAVPQAE